MPRRSTPETSFLLQGLVDARSLAKIVQHYREQGETRKIYNISSLVRAIVNDWARLCGGEEITLIEVAVEILEDEKLMPLREATQKRMLNAEIHQARIEQRAEGYDVTKMELHKEKQSMFDVLAQAAVRKFKEEQKIVGNKETFSERMARLQRETEENKKTFTPEKADAEEINKK